MPARVPQGRLATPVAGRCGQLSTSATFHPNDFHYLKRRVIGVAGAARTAMRFLALLGLLTLAACASGGAPGSDITVCESNELACDDGCIPRYQVCNGAPNCD